MSHYGLRASCHKCSFHKCCRMERNSVEFLEGEIFIISQAPCRLAVMSRAFRCLKEEESFENLYNLCPTTVQRRETIPETFFGHMFQLLFHQKAAQFIIPNQYLHGMEAFCGFLLWKSTRGLVEEELDRMGTSSPDSTDEFPKSLLLFWAYNFKVRGF